MRPSLPSKTAQHVALVRAIESLRPAGRRICWDPYARFFLQGRMKRIYLLWPLRKLFCFTSERYLPGVIGAVLLRTRYIDDWFSAQVTSGVRQVVNLGAGYDTRWLRFSSQLQRARVFEVDHPATQDRKVSLLRSFLPTLPGNLVLVPVRFNRDALDEKLAEVGYRQDLPTAFIWEGVTYYISRSAVERTLAFITTLSAPASAIVFDFFPPTVAEGSSHLKEGRGMHQLFRGIDEAITFGIDVDKLEPFLKNMGFRNTLIVTARELWRKYHPRKGRRLKISDLFSLAVGET